MWPPMPQAFSPGSSPAWAEDVNSLRVSWSPHSIFLCIESGVWPWNLWGFFMRHNGQNRNLTWRIREVTIQSPWNPIRSPSLSIWNVFKIIWNLWWNRRQTLQFSWCWHRTSVGRRRLSLRDVSIYHWGGQTKLVKIPTHPTHPLRPTKECRAFCLNLNQCQLSWSVTDMIGNHLPRKGL